MKDSVLVTATDTGVGKTVVAAGLVLALRMRGFSAAGCKPFATGCREEGDRLVSEDAELLAEACEYELSEELISPVRYRPPLAPAVAARLEQRPVDLDAALQALGEIGQRYDFVVVEGIGGLAVPLTDEMTVADFAASAGLDLVIVARRTLGTLNHTRLTVEYARSRALSIRGIVLAGPAVPEDDLSAGTNLAEIERLTGISVAASIPALPGDAPIDEVIRAAGAHLAPERIMRL